MLTRHGEPVRQIPLSHAVSDLVVDVGGRLALLDGAAERLLTKVKGKAPRAALRPTSLRNVRLRETMMTFAGAHHNPGFGHQCTKRGLKRESATRARVGSQDGASDDPRFLWPSSHERKAQRRPNTSCSSGSLRARSVASPRAHMEFEREIAGRAPGAPRRGSAT